MDTAHAIRSISRDRRYNKREALICLPEDVPAYAHRIARCNLALRRLAVRAARRSAAK